MKNGSSSFFFLAFFPSRSFAIKKHRQNKRSKKKFSILFNCLESYIFIAYFEFKTETKSLQKVKVKLKKKQQQNNKQQQRMGK